MDDSDFLRLIFDSPQAADNKLVYADWLEERGETEAAEAWRYLADKWPWKPAPHSYLNFWLSTERGTTLPEHRIPLGDRHEKGFLEAEHAWLLAVEFVKAHLRQQS